MLSAHSVVARVLQACYLALFYAVVAIVVSQVGFNVCHLLDKLVAGAPSGFLI